MPGSDFEWISETPTLLLNNTQRRVCIDLPVYDDTALEQSEWATLSVTIFYATNTSVVRPVTNIRIDDNGKCSSYCHIHSSNVCVGSARVLLSVWELKCISNYMLFCYPL